MSDVIQVRHNYSDTNWLKYKYHSINKDVKVIDLTIESENFNFKQELSCAEARELAKTLLSYANDIDEEGETA